MTSNDLKHWQSTLGLSEVAMAQYLGVPVHTLRKWLNGTRKPDAAPMRLFTVLQMVQKRAPELHAYLIDNAAPDGAAESMPVTTKQAGKGKGKPRAPEWLTATASTTPVPPWLIG